MEISSNKANLSILIPDGESHILLYVVNCLSQVKHIQLYVMSNKKNNPMRYSRHIKGFSYYAETSSDLDWIDNINKEVEKHNIDVVMPIFETRIRTLIEYKSNIVHHEKLGLLPSLTDFNTAINKGLLAKHLDANCFPNPKSITIASHLELNKVNNLSFPVIMKPVEGFGGGQRIGVFNTIEDLKHHFTKNHFDYVNIVQEYIEGYDIDCSVLCKAGDILAFTIQKGNMIGENQFSPQYGLCFLYEAELYRVVEKLMKSLDWSGVAHIDMRYDQNNNQFKIIEINSRFWVSMDASLLAGVNFPYLYCLSSIGNKYEQPEYEFIEYLNLKGLTRKIKQDIGLVFKTNSILSNTPLKFAVIDPLPMIYKYISRTKNILMAKLH